MNDPTDDNINIICGAPLRGTQIYLKKKLTQTIMFLFTAKIIVSQYT